MFTLILQVLGLLLLFGLIGVLVGWLLRPYFCRPTAKGGSASASASGNDNISKGNRAKITAAAAVKTKAKADADNAAEKAKAAKLAEEQRLSNDQPEAEQDAKDATAKAEAGDVSYESVTDDMRPERLVAPRGGSADDLKRISGIGPVIEGTLNKEGVYHFQQIADFTPDNVNWVDRHISFPGRITREEWIRQAKGLAAGKSDPGAVVSNKSEKAVITEDMRPTRHTLSAGEKADDLKVISGIGPVIEKSLNEAGIHFHQQIADFNQDNAKWVDNHMAFPGRIHREDWIGQAKVLVGQKADPKATAKPATSAVGSALGSSGAVPDSMKPTLLKAPEGGKADDLKRVKGIGKVLEKNLYAMGIYHYEQLAALTPDNISWLTDYVSFPDGRIDDENWTEQGRALAEGKQTEYSQRFDKGDTPYK